MKWNDFTINAFKEASDYTRFHENLANYIKPLLRDCKTLCDIGCGLGLVDMYLKDYVNHITCIDIDENVIRFLENQIKEKDIKNINCYLDDYKSIETYFDVILISFFCYEELDFLSKHCKRLIVVINDRVNSHIPLSSSSIKKTKEYSFENLENLLKENNLNYKFEKYNLEFGQTFKSKEEVEKYAKYYDDGSHYEKHYNHIINNLITKGKNIYYLPYKKKFTIFTVDF